MPSVSFLCSINVKSIKQLSGSALCLAVSLLLASCGFKSDLFLPGEQSKAEQLEVPLIKTIASDTVEVIKEQNAEVVNDTAEPAGIEVEIPLLAPVDETESEKKEKNK